MTACAERHARQDQESQGLIAITKKKKEEMKKEKANGAGEPPRFPGRMATKPGVDRTKPIAKPSKHA
jgi:hypothetical protein